MFKSSVGLLGLASLFAVAMPAFSQQVQVVRPGDAPDSAVES